MKTIFTLLFTVVMLSTTFAQQGQRGEQWNKDKSNDVYVYNENNGYDNHNRNYGGYYFTPRERDMQIARIEREYGYRIQSVKNKPFMGWHQKNRIINNLEAERDDEIARVVRKFRSPKNQYGDYGRRDRKRW